MNPRRIIPSFRAAALFAGLAFVSQAGAATITGVVSPEFPSDATYNLTALGGLDWVYWTQEGSPAANNPTNSKSGAALIGAATAVGGGDVRGSTNTSSVPENYFTFSDGTSPASGTAVQTTGIFNTQLQTSGAGVSVAIDLPTVQSYTVYVWASAFSLSSSTFTASLSGASSFVSTAIMDSTGTSSKDTYLITLTVTPDNPGDDLTITAVAGTSTGVSSHILISGIAVSLATIPEPGAAGVLAGGAALAVAAFYRRRRIA